jgi:2,4-dienoyl-CoA reductase-like NADH-dependent reductase (Old Yellow Enzyme family)
VSCWVQKSAKGATEVRSKTAPASSVNIIGKIRAAFGARLTIAVRMNAFDGVPYTKDPQTGLGVPMNFPVPYPHGWGIDAQDPLQPDLTEVKQLIGWLKDWGVQLINLSLGSPYYNPHIGRPFEKPDEGNYEQPEHPLLGVDRHFRIAGELQTAFPDLPMVGTGYSWLQKYAVNAAAHNLNAGRIRFFGMGRNALAYPGLRARRPRSGCAAGEPHVQDADLLHIPDETEKTIRLASSPPAARHSTRKVMGPS